jgi:CRISPR/Cas system CMR subunit Cmr4 (Cas7 group RAMP superfamily)
MRNKYFIKEGNEELQKSLLLMKYDSNKTLSENKQTTSEQYTAPAVAAGATGAALGGAAAGLSTTTAGASVIVPVMSALGVSAAAAGAIVGGAAALAVGPLVYWLVTKDKSANKVKKMFELCSSKSTEIAKLPRKLGNTDLRDMTDNITDAIEGMGTDEEKLFAQFKRLESGTASDFCALVKYYNSNSDSGDLYDDLDSDIDSDTEWNQIFRPIRNCVEDSLLSLKETPTPTPTKTQPSEKVKKIQQMLVRSGYYIGNTGSSKNGVDGYYGNRTDMAYKAWNGGESAQDFNNRVYKMGKTTQQGGTIQGGTQQGGTIQGGTQQGGTQQGGTTQGGTPQGGTIQGGTTQGGTTQGGEDREINKVYPNEY